MIVQCGTCKAKEERCPVCGSEVELIPQSGEAKQWYRCTCPDCRLGFVEGTGGLADHHICDLCINQFRKDFGLDDWLLEQRVAIPKVLPMKVRTDVRKEKQTTTKQA